MLPKPSVPVGPVIVKDTMVVVVDWVDVIVTFDICCAVTFPLMVSSTVPPLLVVACIVEVEPGEGVGVGEAVGVDDELDEFEDDEPDDVGGGVGVGLDAKLAVIVPGPFTSAVVDMELGLEKVIEPLLAVHCENE